MVVVVVVVVFVNPTSEDMKAHSIIIIAVVVVPFGVFCSGSESSRKAVILLMFRAVFLQSIRTPLHEVCKDPA